MTPDTNTYHKAVHTSQNRYIWLFVLLAIALVGIFFGTKIYVDYTRAIRTAEERLLTQTRVIDENIVTNLTVVNLLLNDVASKLKDTSASSQLNHYLKHHLSMPLGIRTLLITDSQGNVTYSNRDELIGKDFPKNRDYFKVPRDAPDKGMLFLSPPYTTILGKYVLNITKPLIGKQDEFNGIVSVTLDPEYFAALLSSTIYTPDNRVSLVYDNGTVFIAVPEARIQVAGTTVTHGSAFLQHLSSGRPTSVRVAVCKILGDKRLFAYRTNIPKGVRFDRQLIVIASRNLHEVLAVWRFDTGIELAIFLLFASVSIFITKTMLRHGGKLKRLEESRAHLAAIVEFSDDAIISLDMNGVILSWNAGAERLFAYTADEAIGQSIAMLIPPELQDEENRILQNLKAGELVAPLRTVRIAKDGDRIDVSVTSSPLKDTTGMIIVASKIIRDITECKLAEQGLLESQLQLQIAHSRQQIVSEELELQNEELQNQNQELKVLWEKSRQAEASLLESRHDLDRAQEVGSIGSWRLDIRINLLTWSDENYRIFGISKGTPLTYETFLSSIHPDDRHYVDTQWNAGLRGEPYDIEHRLLINDQVKWVREKAYLEFEKDGTLIGGYGITQDITDRKQAEIALQESEQRTQQALQVSRSFTFDWVPVTDQVVRSASCAVILKLTGDEAVHDTGGHYFQCIHPDDSVHFVQKLHGLTPASDSYTAEYRYICTDGSEITLEEIGQASFDANGKMIRLVGVATDITLRKNAEIALKSANEELERRVAERTRELAASINHLQSEIRERELAEETIRKETSERLKAVETLREKEQMLLQQSRQAAMGEMIGNIAHQWRQPLNTLGLYTQRLGIFYGSPDFNKEFLDSSIAKSMEIIKHMSKTIDDFRDYFKPEKEKADFNVIEAIKNTLSLLEGSFQNPKITIDVAEHDNPVITGYQNEFSQVFLNILNNAREVLIEREIADARVLITIGSVGNSAVVTVADNAGGIPDELINKVFDPYFTTKGPQAGTGIGLFMSKTIIEKNMGGRLTVRNTDTGAEFRIEVEHATQN